MDGKQKGGLPLGFGMALAQNEEAMQVFSSLSREGKKACIEKAKKASTKEEMAEIVNGITPDSHQNNG